MSNAERQGPLTGDQIERRILEFAKQRYPELAHIRSFTEAHECGIEPQRYEEILLLLHARQFIQLMRYHDESGRACAIEEWGGPGRFFAATTDGGYVRVRLLEGGQRFLESLQEPPKRTIGFSA